MLNLTKEELDAYSKLQTETGLKGEELIARWASQQNKGTKTFLESQEMCPHPADDYFDLWDDYLDGFVEERDFNAKRRQLSKKCRRCRLLNLP